MPWKKINQKKQEKTPKQPKISPGKNNRYLDKNDELLNLFLAEIRRFPIYSNRRLISLVDRAKQGDTEARQQIVESCYRFIVSIAKNFQSSNLGITDLIQEGFLGLLDAIERYDPTKKVPFVHFASWWIKKRIVKYIWWYRTTVRLPENQQKALNKLVKLSTRFIMEHNRVPSIGELLEDSGLPEWVVSGYLNLFKGGNVKEVVNMTIDDIQDVGPIDDNSDPGIIIDKELRAKAVVQCLDTLKPKYREFIKDYFGIGRPALSMAELTRVHHLSTGGAVKRKTKILNYLKENYGDVLRPYLNVD